MDRPLRFGFFQPHTEPPQPRQVLHDLLGLLCRQQPPDIAVACVVVDSLDFQLGIGLAIRNREEMEYADQMRRMSDIMAKPN